MDYIFVESPFCSWSGSACIADTQAILTEEHCERLIGADACNQYSSCTFDVEDAECVSIAEFDAEQELECEVIIFYFSVKKYFSFFHSCW